jgi:predicted protein tyrosine phosphatase
MKIYVCSKQEMKEQYKSNKDWYNDETKFFISIAGFADGCEYPCPFLTVDSQHVCHLLFDDVTDYFKDCPNVNLFCEEHADKIFNFVKQIPDNNKNTIYVNCAAGISRSGAVGYVINLYFNKFLNDNVEDYKFFEKINTQIQPNPYVKSLLMKKFGLTY